MPNSLNISLCQLDFSTANVEINYQKISYHINQNHDKDLIIFPELSLSGYDCQDLFLQNSFITNCENKILQLTKQTLDKNCYVIVGSPYLIINNQNQRKLYNAAFVLYQGEIIDIICKNNLPNYSIFDEKRYFTKNDRLKSIIIKGRNISVLICEDMWNKKTSFLLKEMEVDVVISINASPFDKQKKQQRLEAAKFVNKEISKPFIYLNQVGGHDEIIFDGSSFVTNSRGEVIMQMPSFVEKITQIQLEKIDQQKLQSIAKNQYHDLYQACVLGLRDYVTKIGFSKVLLGMSGGIDSALVANIAVDAFGSENVSLFALPSKFNSNESHEDALQCSKNLGIKLDSITIEPIFTQFKDSLSKIFIGLDEDKTEENLQSRIRGNILMAISNKLGKLLLTTGNKSEIAVGYSTIYGDMCGAYNPIKDLYKTEVFALAKWRNENIPEISIYQKKNLIPARIIAKEPSAELSFNQKDSDSLPEYEILDKILLLLIEERKSSEEIIAQGFDSKVVNKVFKLVKNSEFKRSQSAKGVILSKVSLGRDWRFSIT
jgi:NAD+ synthetase